MYQALDDIQINEPICFFNGFATPLKTQESFLSAQGPIQNSLKSYKRGELINIDGIDKDLIALEVENIKKLNGIQANASLELKQEIQKFISLKLKTLHEMTGYGKIT